MSAGRRHLLDSSAVLALVLNEAGADKVQAVLDDSQMLGFNAAEVARKLISKGVPAAEVAEVLGALNLETDGYDFSFRQSIHIGHLAAANRKIGLALGDAVCLIAAASSGLKIVTADKLWQECVWPEMDGIDNRPEIITIR